NGLFRRCDPAQPDQNGSYHQAEGESADVGEEGHAAAVRGGVEQTEIGFDELIKEPQSQEDPGWNPDQEDGKNIRADPGTRVKNKVGTQHSGDGAAGPEFRHLGALRGTEKKGHGGLREHGDESAHKVEGQVRQGAKRVLDVFSKNEQKEHVAENVVPAAM